MKWIVSPRIDLSCFILAALAGYALLAANVLLGVSSFLLWWFWNVSMNGAHFFATILRTYLDREEWRTRPGLLLGSLLLIGVGPLAIWLSLALGTRLPFVLFSLQLTAWAYYHVVRQHYGFVALYQKAYGEQGSSERRFDYWVFHTLMFAPALIWFLRNPGLLGSAEPGGGALQAVLVWPVGAALVIALAAWVGGAIRGHRAGRLNVPKALLVLAYLPLHLLVFLYPPVAGQYDPYLTNAVLTYPHNIQYMAIVWFYSRKRYHGAAGGPRYGAAARLSRSLATFCAAAFAYGLIYYYADWFLEGMSVPGAPGAFFLARTPLRHEGGPTVADLVASIWVGFAFHHYYLDGRIWRVNHDRRLARDLDLAAAPMAQKKVA